MKKAILATLILTACLFSCTKEKAYVVSTKGLPLRDQPSFENSKIITMMPYTSEVVVLDKDGPIGEWQSYRGPWYKVTFGEATGWAFTPKYLVNATRLAIQQRRLLAGTFRPLKILGLRQSI